MSDEIEIDETPETAKPTPVPVKPKKAAPVWAVILVILSFGCLVGVLTLQFLEYRYLRGAGPSETDPYAAQVLIPPRS